MLKLEISAESSHGKIQYNWDNNVSSGVDYSFKKDELLEDISVLVVKLRMESMKKALISIFTRHQELKAYVRLTEKIK